MKRKLLVSLLSLVLVVTMIPLQAFAQSGASSSNQATNEEDYLNFTATNGPVTIKLIEPHEPMPDMHLVYSLDKSTWRDFGLRDSGGVTIEHGSTVYFKLKEGAEVVYPGREDREHWQFELAGSDVVAGGSVMSLVSEDPSATVIEEPYAFHYLFAETQSLIKAPRLPAIDLSEGCYEDMFEYSGITEMPELPAEYLAKKCYDSMFYGCSKIKSISILPSTHLAEGCYRFMFQYCNGLKQAPVLPAKTLATDCYRGMFMSCRGLETPPKLPATKLEPNCYFYMFGSCDLLNEAPELPATTLAPGCYESMFSGCRKLEIPPVLPATKMEEMCYDSMFDSCTSLKYAPKLPAKELGTRCYWGMFYGCSLIETPPELPATELTEGCYASMFGACKGLTTVPKLPAKELTPYCYQYMFVDCVKIETPPELPGLNAKNDSYSGMFQGCTALKEAPELPSQTVGSWSYQYMFKNCTSLKTAPSLPAEKLGTSSYVSMFEGCTSLENGPVIGATSFGLSSMKNMFSGCEKLKSITVSFSDWGEARSATTDWVKGVGKEGVFSCVDDLSKVYDTSHIPEGWKINLSYRISKTNPKHGTILSKVGGSYTSVAKPGDKVQLEYQATTEGYELDTFTVMQGETPIKVESDNTFIMPAGSVTVTATEFGPYHITTSAKHGTITISPQKKSYESGEVITVGYESEEGYEAAMFIAREESGRQVLIRNNQFTMPASNVTVEVIEMPVPFEISVNESEHGTIKISGYAYAGDEVKFTDTPEEGYKLGKVTVVDSKGNPVPVVDNSFLMPASKVTVTAEFVPIDPEYIPVIQEFETWAPDHSQINVVWKKASSSRVQYWLYRSTEPYGDWGEPIAKMTNGQTSYADTDVEAGVKYYYLMRGAVKVGEQWTFGDYTRMDFGYPRVEDILHFESWASDENRVNLHWLRAKNPRVVYFIYRGYQPYGDWGDAIDVLSNATTDYHDKGFKPGVKNYYMARPAILNEDGTYSFGEYTKMDYAWPRKVR